MSLKLFQLKNIMIQPKQKKSGMFQHVYCILNGVKYGLTPLALILKIWQAYMNTPTGNLS